MTFAQAQFYSDLISHNVIIPLLSGEFCSRCMIQRSTATLQCCLKEGGGVSCRKEQTFRIIFTFVVTYHKRKEGNYQNFSIHSLSLIKITIESESMVVYALYEQIIKNWFPWPLKRRSVEPQPVWRHWSPFQKNAAEIFKKRKQTVCFVSFSTCVISYFEYFEFALMN